MSKQKVSISNLRKSFENFFEKIDFNDNTNNIDTKCISYCHMCGQKLRGSGPKNFGLCAKHRAIFNHNGIDLGLVISWCTNYYYSIAINEMDNVVTEN